MGLIFRFLFKVRKKKLHDKRSHSSNTSCLFVMFVKISLCPWFKICPTCLWLHLDSDKYTVLIYLQYYDDTYPTVKEQKAFEKNIFNKTHRTDSKQCFLYKKTYLLSLQYLISYLKSIVIIMVFVYISFLLFYPLRWDSITGGPDCCVQEQYRPVLLCDWKLTWKWGKL